MYERVMRLEFLFYRDLISGLFCKLSLWIKLFSLYVFSVSLYRSSIQQGFIQDLMNF